MSVNGQEPIYDVGWIGTPPTLIEDDAPIEVDKPRKRKTQRLNYPKKERFSGTEVKAPKIIYIDN